MTDSPFTIETISVIIGIIGIVGVAVGFYVRLQNTVNNVKDKIDNHPFLKAFDKAQERQNIQAVENLLRNWRQGDE